MPDDVPRTLRRLRRGAAVLEHRDRRIGVARIDIARPPWNASSASSALDRQSPRSCRSPRRFRHAGCGWPRRAPRGWRARRWRRGRRAKRAWSSAAFSNPRAAPVPGSKKPRSRAGRGSFQNTRPFSAVFNVGRKPVGSNHHDHPLPTPPGTAPSSRYAVSLIKSDFTFCVIPSIADGPVYPLMS